MADYNSIKSIECNETSNLNTQHFIINKINEIKDYFIAKIKERKLLSKRFSKYIGFFYYLDKSLVVLSVTSGSYWSYSYWNTCRNSKRKF